MRFFNQRKKHSSEVIIMIKSEIKIEHKFWLLVTLLAPTGLWLAICFAETAVDTYVKYEAWKERQAEQAVVIEVGNPVYQLAQGMK